jgi:hypothetical protein
MVCSFFSLHACPRAELGAVPGGTGFSLLSRPRHCRAGLSHSASARLEFAVVACLRLQIKILADPRNRSRNDR